MKDQSSIEENELDGALNALFLETYSSKENEDLARFVLEQDYNVEMTEKKKKKLVAKLKGRRGGLFLLLALIGLIITFVLPLYLSLTDSKGKTHFPNPVQPVQPLLRAKQMPANTPAKVSDKKTETTHLEMPEVSPGSASNNTAIVQQADSGVVAKPAVIENKVPADNKKKTLPYFDEAGLLFFQQVKDDLFKRLLKADVEFYTKIEPGSTMYKNREVLVSPFVMSSLPVTNLHYKVFLADLFRQGKITELEKCLPKDELWNEYSCAKLASSYFKNESYNYFPVVNIGKEAMELYCLWMAGEMNKALSSQASGKSKSSSNKKEVIVRLPYDYEWIYAADASYAIIPDCGGYNTIYDPSEGLVNNTFYKRTSQLNKQSKKKLNRIDQLNDINRFGMSENEMISIFKEGMNFKQPKANPADLYYSKKVEDCCLAGHVVEVINTKDGGTTLRGCCWKDKEEYLKMSSTYKKFNASPFVGFRVVYVTKNGTYKEPFW